MPQLCGYFETISESDLPILFHPRPSASLMSFNTLPAQTRDESEAYAAVMEQYYAYLSFLAQAGYQQAPPPTYPSGAALPFPNQVGVGDGYPSYPHPASRTFLFDLADSYSRLSLRRIERPCPISPHVSSSRRKTESSRKAPTNCKADISNRLWRRGFGVKLRLFANVLWAWNSCGPPGTTARSRLHSRVTGDDHH